MGEFKHGFIFGLIVKKMPHTTPLEQGGKKTAIKMQLESKSDGQNGLILGLEVNIFHFPILDGRAQKWPWRGNVSSSLNIMPKCLPWNTCFSFFLKEALPRASFFFHEGARSGSLRRLSQKNPKKEREHMKRKIKTRACGILCMHGVSNQENGTFGHV